MAKAEFSLKERDKMRLFKDRFARFFVKSSGMGILAAILLIFFYLVSIVLPIFSSVEVTPIVESSYFVNQNSETNTEQGESNTLQAFNQANIVGLGVGNYGENAFVFTSQGQLSYVGLEKDKATILLTTQVIENPSAFAQSAQSQGWFAYGNDQGELFVVKPEFSVSFADERRVLTPNLHVFNDEKPLILDSEKGRIDKIAFSISDNTSDQTGVFVTLSATGDRNAIKVIHRALPDNQETWTTEKISLPTTLPNTIDQIEISPDGKQLFVLSGNELFIAEQKNNAFTIRESVDLSRGHPEQSVENIRLLSGAHSILVSHYNDQVSQWFDVLKSGERVLTKIRLFSLPHGNEFLLTDSYRKGFYSFSKMGTMQSYYTTSEKHFFSGQLYPTLPDIAAISDNERYVIAITGHQLFVHELINAHPEVSFSTLWGKVWYENYPDPQYVWQSTSANDDFEAKLSLIPIAFGTLKATFFALVFSIPIAVFGAIYTAYFMSSSMRRVVKPSIEIMEALPTVIIGFLAGLWLAPIVENNLTGVIALMMMLPLSMIIVSLFWTFLLKRFMQQVPSGWHVLILVPVIVLVAYLSIAYSAEIELQLFNGDIRLFLAEYGMNYDQRNALVVGFAMGFAVIPTIFTIAEDAIFSVPKHLSDGSLALGATQWQTLVYVVLFTASPGIFSAIMIGLGRAVGETMIVLMATGNTPIMDFNIFEGMRSLSATIAVEMPESEVGDTHYRVLFLAALVLFIFTFAVNSVAEVIRQRLKDRYSSM